MTGVQFSWDDPLLLERQLTMDEIMVRDAAHVYAEERLAPRVQQAFREERTDPEIFREMGDLGLLGTTIPEEYGGGGLNYVSYGLIAREIERVDSGYPLDALGAVIARDAADLQVRHRGAAQEISAGARARRSYRLFRIDRAGSWVGSGQHDHACAQRERRLPLVGREDLDLQQPDRRRASSSGRRPRTS